MGTGLVQIIILAAIALFLFLRLRSVLGTRDGYEPNLRELSNRDKAARDKKKFEVIEGGGIDHDIADYAEPDTDTFRALTEMKKVEPGFSVHEFVHGARQAYEMILMAFERGDLKTLEAFLSPEVYASFADAVTDRADRGLTVEADFVGIREIKLEGAEFDQASKEADITMRFVGELTSVVRGPDGDIVEGDTRTIKRQKDLWTFSRVMGSENPNWLLVATGG
jgi:predicted lipid-binding transport protein (Tim44 family)